MRLASLAVLVASAVALPGCLVPELDNYPADKSKGSGTVVFGEDAAANSGVDNGSGVQTGGCIPGTYSGSVSFDGSGSSDSFNGQCTVGGSVNVFPTATAAEIDKLQRIQWIDGTLTLNAPALASNLTLAYLQTVGSVISIENSGSLQELTLSGLVQTGGITIKNNSSLVLFVAGAIANPIQNITVTGNTALQALDLSGYQVTGALNVSNNSQLTRVSMTNLSSVTQLLLNNNQALNQMLIPTSVVVSSQWSLCQDPSLDGNWLAAFQTAHALGGMTCN